MTRKLSICRCKRWCSTTYLSISVFYSCKYMYIVSKLWLICASCRNRGLITNCQMWLSTLPVFAIKLYFKSHVFYHVSVVLKDGRYILILLWYRCSVRTDCNVLFDLLFIERNSKVLFLVFMDLIISVISFIEKETFPSSILYNL